jgi:hypothetical protein
VDDPSVTDNLLVILGPRTALAAQILAMPWASENDVLLVARHSEEASALASHYPCARVLSCGAIESQWRCPAAVRAVTVVLCAFGLIHPVMPDWASHSMAMSRDLKAVTKILDRCRPCPVTLIFVSTALAAVPNKKRSYYVGWKYLAEAVLEKALEGHQGGHFCVLLPGRLASKRTLVRPLSLLHTTYSRLARIIIETARAPRTQRQIVGLDARALMLVGAVRLLVNGVLGRSA